MEKLSVDEVMSEFNVMFRKIDKNLIKKTNLYFDEVKQMYNSLYPELKVYLKEKGYTTDKLAVANNEKHLLNRCVENIYDKYKNEINPFELAEVKNILGRASDYYDMNDGRVYILVKQLIDMVLTIVRLQIDLIDSNTLMESMSDNGIQRHYSNPILKIKLDYNLGVVKLITELNKIIEGEKINNRYSLDIQVFNRDELYKKVIDVIPEREE